jgi:glycosyltransferase involved in cell wall biosynthesis
MLPFVSVIVVTKNNAQTIEKCIKSLLTQDYPSEFYEIVFVDGHSVDGTDEIIKKYAKDYPIIQLHYEEHGTIGYARNVGINKSRGEIILFIDGDAYSPKEWIKKIVEKFINNDRLAIIGGLDVLVSSGRVISSSSSVIDSWRRLKRNVGIKAIPCIKTVNFAIKRTVALACGGFDPTLSYWEEPELMARLYVKMGIDDILYDPKIIVYHQRRIANTYSRIRKVFRNSVICVPVFLRKHMIHVALANPASPLATNLYMVFACVIGIPLLTCLTAYGLLLSSLTIILPLYLFLLGIYTFYACVRTKKFTWTLPFTLTLSCTVRLVGTLFGLIRWLWKVSISR